MIFMDIHVGGKIPDAHTHTHSHTASLVAREGYFSRVTMWHNWASLFGVCSLWCKWRGACERECCVFSPPGPLPGAEAVTSHQPNSNLGPGGLGPKGSGHTRRRGRREQHPAGAVGGGVEQHPAVVQAMLKR